MTLPLFRCVEGALIDQCPDEYRDDILFGTLILDPFLFITSLVVAILGLTTTVSSIPCGASYALIGVSCTIALSYLAYVLKICYCEEKETPAGEV